jgi:hypothetical protein
MAVYIDKPRKWKKGQRTVSCHLIGDTIGEMILFACSIGLVPAYMQDRTTRPHFDLYGEKIKMAKERGAITIESNRTTYKSEGTV